MCSEDIYPSHLHIISKQTAKHLGMKRFFTGKPCKHGHVAERMVGNGGCLHCHKLKCEKYRKHNKEKVSESSKRYYHNNRDSYLKYKKEYYKENKNDYMEYQKEYRKKRYSTDPSFKMAKKMRSMVERVFNLIPERKNSSSFDLLGYNPEDLKLHIESLFLEGMSWDNYGEWHIDHIFPVIKYIRMGVKDPKIINSLSNLQPMWAEDNISKGNMTFEEWKSVCPLRAKLYG